MNKLLGTAFMAASLSIAANAALAGEQVSESRTIDARVTKVRLEGTIGLHIRQGATPSLVIRGDRDDVAKVTTTQNGDTLQLDTDNHGLQFGWRKHDLHADLTVPNLAEFISQGVGSTVVNGFSGDKIRFALDGAGGVTVDARYQNIDARLGGVGSLTLNNVNAERIDLSLRGAGHIAVKGQAKVLRARLGGVGGLDARDLTADTVDLDMSGLGGATVYAKTSANLSLSGLGSAKVYGNPTNRNATTSGLGSVSWR